MRGRKHFFSDFAEYTYPISQSIIYTLIIKKAKTETKTERPPDGSQTNNNQAALSQAANRTERLQTTKQPKIVLNQLQSSSKNPTEQQFKSKNTQ